jgi:hypothetical protein
MNTAVKKLPATRRGDFFVWLCVLAFFGFALFVYLDNGARNAARAEYCAKPNDTGKTRLACLSKPVQR